MPGAASTRYSRITKCAARSRVVQPSQRVGASGPTLRMVATRAARSRCATDTGISLHRPVQARLTEPSCHGASLSCRHERPDTPRSVICPSSRWTFLSMPWPRLRRKPGTSPSNLAGWTIRELVGHATGSAAKIVALLEGAEIWRGPSQPDGLDHRRAGGWPSRVVRQDAQRNSRCRLRGASAVSGGEVPLRRALGFPVADLALHSWDIHRSQGRLTELPDDVLVLTRALVEALPEAALRRPGAFGPSTARAGERHADHRADGLPRPIGLVGQRQADLEAGPGRQVVRRQRAAVGLHQAGRDGQP